MSSVDFVTNDDADWLAVGTQGDLAADLAANRIAVGIDDIAVFINGTDDIALGIVDGIAHYPTKHIAVGVNHDVGRSTRQCRISCLAHQVHQLRRLHAVEAAGILVAAIAQHCNQATGFLGAF